MAEADWTLTLSGRSTTKFISSEHGLRRTLLGLLPLSITFSSFFLGQLERSI
jgi:hypothetical protein